jgi:hypothetical protein
MMQKRYTSRQNSKKLYFVKSDEPVEFLII